MADLKSLCESAIITWLGATATHSQALGITPRASINDDTNVLPRIVCKCTVGSEHIHGTGIYQVEAEVGYFWQADDTTDTDAKTLWGKVGYIMRWDQLAARLSSANTLTVWGVIWGDGNESHDISERHHEQRLTLRLIAQPS